MKVTATAIPEVLILEPKVFGDSRGYFLESYNRRVFAPLGITSDFVQDNQSKSQKNVIRGLHYQIKQTQGKLVRSIAGSIFDVVVDLRRSSPTFGKWVGEELSKENHKMIWVPRGFAHGFLVLSDEAEVAYKADDFWAPEWERSVIWNDPDIRIEWPLSGDPVLSSKDALGKKLRDAEVFE
jgi:dTDP-4-dehydrorhamnose 3,5-epimerase